MKKGPALAAPRTPPPLNEIYSRVWKACFSLWPLLAVQFLFALLQWGALVVCAIILFGTLIAKYFGILVRDPQALDMTQMASDWAERFTDPAWIGILLGMVFLYLTWWLLLSAVVEGGVFRAFWRHRQTGEAFSLVLFFKEGLQYFIPMVWLQFFLSLYGFALFIIFTGSALVLIGVVALCHLHWALVLLLCAVLGAPLLLFWILACLLFVLYTFTAKARLTLGDRPRAAMAKAFQDCRENRYRILKAGMTVFAVYLLASIGLQVGLAIFTLIPVIGLLFVLARAALGAFLALLLQTGLSGLSVHLVAEREGVN